ncbi:hypothetical protein RJ43_12255 [Alteromonas macleodii]|nr:hypothetical protein RJ43_12255 [Alteromonas macleodii]
MTLIVPLCYGEITSEQTLIFSEVEGKLLKANNSSILTKIEILSSLKKQKKDSQYNLIVNDYLQFYYSLLSDYHAVLEVQNDVYPTINSSLDISNYSAEPAVLNIVDKAKNVQVTMINEAHHIAQHRVLTRGVLKQLYEIGYRFFAVEALSIFDNDSGDIRLSDGYYTQETIFADTINFAREIGYEIIAYDLGYPTLAEREKEAAKKLYKNIFAEDIHAKVLIHVGYAHIDEKDMLAGYLKRLLNVEILTIDQTKLREKSDRKDEHEYYKKAVSIYNGDGPFVLKAENGELWSASANSFDVSVFWQRTQYVSGRAQWMKLGRIEWLVEGDLLCSEVPCVLEVFNGKEDSFLADKIPNDRIALYEKGDQAVLFLQKGHNFIRIKNSEGKPVGKKEIFLAR